MNTTPAAEALAYLHKTVPARATLYTITRHVTGAGKSVSVIYIDPTGVPHDLDWAIAQVGLGKFDTKHGGIRTTGVGVDLAYQLVYNMSRRLYPEAERFRQIAL